MSKPSKKEVQNQGTDEQKEKEALVQEIVQLKERIKVLEQSLNAGGNTENELFESRNMLRLVFDNIPQRVFWKDENLYYLGCNKLFAMDAGLDNPDDIVGKNDYDIIWKEQAEKYRADDKHVMDNDIAKINFEERQTRPDGSVSWLSTSKIPLHDRNGKVIGILGTYEDITNSKLAQESFQKERILLRTLIDNIPDSVYVKDLECRKTLANKAELRNVNVKSEEEILGKNDFDVYDKETAEAFYKDDLEVLKGRPVLNREESFIDSEGKRKWLLTSKLPLVDEKGVINGLIGIGRDITERRNAELSLQESSENFNLIFQYAHDGMSMYYEDPETLERTLVNCNERYAELAGRTKEEMLQRGSSIDLQIPLSKEESNEKFYKGSFSWKRPDGKDNIIEYTAVPITINDKRYIVGIDRDVTSSRRAEEAIQLERNFLKTLIDSLPDLIFFKDTEGRYILNNESHLKYLGAKSQEEVLNKTAYDFQTKETAKKFFEEEMRVMQSGYAVREVDEVVHDKRTGENRWHLTSKIPIKDSTGKVKGLLGVSHDITHRKVAENELKQTYQELQKINDDLQQANKVKSQFLANMSHEIRTPLNAVIGLTNLLLSTQLNDEQKDFVETINSSGDILLTLINDILDFSKIEAQKIELEKQLFDVRLCVEEALDIVAPKASDKNLELLYTIDESLTTKVYGDITRLRQIIVNLLSNAIKFTEKGEVVVSVTGQLLDNNMYQLYFTVKDTGMGIAPDLQNRLFQSFYQVDASTTRKYGGTGLGLAISRQLSELMGGRMWVESSGVPGEGTTFHFIILTEISQEQESVDALPQLSGKRLLIVDDNKTNREILIRQTKRFDMIPYAKASGHEALELLKMGALFDIAILDFQMPVMNGITLAHEIRKIGTGKNLPLILLSSFIHTDKSETINNFSAILSKPIKALQLQNALMTVLSKASPVTRKDHVSSPSNTSIGHEHPLRVLLAEDNSINQKVATIYLEKIGYKADIAFNGLEVLEAMNRQVYDIILMDIQMPEMDGEQATIEIRKKYPPERQPHIVAMTANALKSDSDRYLQVGMNSCIIKPFKMDELIKVLLESNRLGEENKSEEELT